MAAPPDLVADLAAAVADLGERHSRVLVGIDGPDAAGKSILADRLSDALTGDVVRASIDRWHHPADVRRRAGALSPLGYYRDSFDLAGLDRELLHPFQAGYPAVRTQAYDHCVERTVEAHPAPVAARSVLVLDGVFLLRPELRPRWTLAVRLEIPPAETLRRALLRDVAAFGSAAEVRTRYEKRYLPAQALYDAEVDPRLHAHVVVDNTEPDLPRVTKWAVPSAPR